MMIASFIAMVFMDINVIYILICAIVIGLIRAYVEGDKKC